MPAWLFVVSLVAALVGAAGAVKVGVNIAEKRAFVRRQTRTIEEDAK